MSARFALRILSGPVYASWCVLLGSCTPSPGAEPFADVGTATGGASIGSGGTASTGGVAAIGADAAGGVAAGGHANTGGLAATGAGSTTGGATASGSAPGTAGASSGGTSTGGVGGATGGSTTGGLGGVEPGSTGGVSTGATSPRGPTPPSSTAKFPFPQNRQSSRCVYPAAYDNQDVKEVYDAWKADLVTSDGAGGFRRVQRPAEPGLQVGSTVSEGIGYGMIIAVYMDDQELFDDLWKYALAHTWTHSPYGGGSTPTLLMNWYILADGNVSTQASGGQDGHGAATDADEDIAWGLVMADRQWGGAGSLDKTYLDYAKQLIGDIWTYEIDNYRLPKNGSGWGSDKSLNISYFAPSYYRVFAKVTGEERWGKDVIDYVYEVISNNLNETNGNQDNGLVPAFSQSNGTPAEVGMGQPGLAFNYQYDSCRTPFRIGLDACFSGDARAIAYVAKTSKFFSEIGAASIVDGYELDGTPKPQYPSDHGGLSAAFIGPAGVGAMHDALFQSFVDDVYALVRQNSMWCGGQYYDESWTMLSMLMMTGNFVDYTQYE